MTAQRVPSTKKSTTPRSVSSGDKSKTKATTRYSKSITCASPAPDQLLHASQERVVGSKLKTKATNHPPQPIVVASSAPQPIRSSKPIVAALGSKLKATTRAAKTVIPSSSALVPHDIDTHSANDEGEFAAPTNLSKIQTISDPRAMGWLELRTWASMYDDAQRNRIAQSNRVGSGSIDASLFEAHITMLRNVEEALELPLHRCYRRVVPPEIVAWQKREHGIGEHLLSRLLGALGDPYIAIPHIRVDDPPKGHTCDPLRCGDDGHLVALIPRVRLISQLWSYCGVGDATRKRKKGMSQADAFALGSPRCKTFIYLLAKQCVMQKGRSVEALLKGQQSPSDEGVARYRAIYEEGRLRYRDREGWSLGRQDNAALRLVKKEILRDMWIERHRAVGLEAT